MPRAWGPTRLLTLFWHREAALGMETTRPSLQAFPLTVPAGTTGASNLSRPGRENGAVSWSHVLPQTPLESMGDVVVSSASASKKGQDLTALPRGQESWQPSLAVRLK